MESESDGKSGIPVISRIKPRSNLPVLKLKPRATTSDQEQPQLKPKTQFPVLDKSPVEMDESENTTISSVHIGERVCISNVKCGVLRFVGSTAFASGLWCGVELDEPVGKNNGVVAGFKYFNCKENHGIFAPPSKIQLLGPKSNVRNNVAATILNRTVNIESSKFESLDRVGNVASSDLNLTTNVENPVIFDSCVNSVNDKTINLDTSSDLLAKSKLMQPRVFSKSGYFPPLQPRNSATPEYLQSEKEDIVTLQDDLPCLQDDDIRENDVIDKINQTYNRSPAVCPKPEEAKFNGTFVKTIDSTFVKDSNAVLQDVTFVAMTSANHELPAQKRIINESFTVDDITDCRNNDQECADENEDDLNAKLRLDDNRFDLNAELSNFDENKLDAEFDHCDSRNDYVPEDEIFIAEALDLVKCLKDDFRSTRAKSSLESTEDGEKEEVDSVFDFDESLGILTPNQLKDLACLESNFLKTPSVEDICELNDEVADDLNPDIVKDSAEKIPIDAPITAPITSTPCEDGKRVDKSSMPDIMSVHTPFVDRNISYFDPSNFKTPMSITPISARYLEPTNLSSISSIDDHKQSSNFFFATPQSTENAPNSKPGKNLSYTENSPFNQGLNKLSDDNCSSGDEKLSIKWLPLGGMNTVAEKLSEGLISQSLKEATVASCLVSNQPHNLVTKEHKSFSSNLDPAAQFIEDQIPAEMLLQRMGNNFYEVVEKKDRPVSSLTMSVTSIDTGYQGDAECDVQSGAASAINTPIEEQKKSFGADEKEIHLVVAAIGDPHCVLRHPRTDVGSDSDFCSDMGTSWTESEVEGDDKIRGRAARVIDGTLYYNDADSEEKTVKVENSHICDIITNTSATKPLDFLPCLLDDSTKKLTENQKESDTSTLEDSQSQTAIEKCTEQSENSLDKPSTSFVSDETEKSSASDTSKGVCGASFVIAPVSSLDVTSNDNGNTTVTIQRNQNGSPNSKKLSSAKAKDNDSPPVKKYKSPKKKVMSKIKAMIDATTCKSVSNKEGDNEDQQSPPKKLVRTPRKSNRWEAVMSKIAAGQAEEKAKGKGKREVKSKVNTNLTGALKSTSTAKNIDDVEISGSNLGKSPIGDPTHLLKRDSTLSSELTAENGSEEGDHHVHQLNSSNRSSRSDLSGKTISKSKLPRMSVTERPLSPSQLSDISTMSAASRLSSFSQTSRSSSRAIQKGPLSPRKDTTVLRKDISCNSLRDRSQSSLPANVLKNNKKNAANISTSNRVPTSLAKAKKPQPLPNGSPRTTAASPKAASAVQGSSTACQPSPSRLSKIITKPPIPQKRTNACKMSPANHGQLTSKAEQNRVRNLKSASGIIQSSHPHQPDLLNLSSAAETKAEAEKEIVRLEALCEEHAKENSRLKALLEQRTKGFDAFTVVIKYMVEELEPFSHPTLTKDLTALQSTLDACRVNLDETILEKTELQTKTADLIAAHSDEVTKLKEEHSNEIDALRESLRIDYETEVQKLKDKFTDDQEQLKELHEKELLDTKHRHEESDEKSEQRYSEDILHLKNEHETQLRDCQMQHETIVESLKKDYSILQSNLEEQLQSHKRQKREFEETILKDSDLRFQVAAAKVAGLEKEVDSLKAVIELRSNEIHELRTVNSRVKQLEDELYFSEEKVKLLSTRAEDLQAQVDNRIRKERQLSNEHQLLQQWFEKESQVSKRLSMENDELQWKLQQSVEGAALAAMLSGTSPGVPDFSQMGKFCMTSSTPIIAGASDGEKIDCKQQLYKSGYDFGSKKAMSLRGLSPMTNRRRRQRYSVSEEDSSIPTRDVSPGSRYRRTQSLSWTVGLKSPDFPKKRLLSPVVKDKALSNENVKNETDESIESSVFGDSLVEEENVQSEVCHQSILDVECESRDGAIVSNENENQNVQHSDKIEENCVCDKVDSEIDVKPKPKPLERRRSSIPDARVPTLITAKHLEDQSTSSKRMHQSGKIARRRSLSNSKTENESPSPTRSCHSAGSWCESKSKSAKSSPTKVKSTGIQSGDKKDLPSNKTKSKLKEKLDDSCINESQDVSNLKRNSVEEVVCPQSEYNGGATTLMTDDDCRKEDVKPSILDSIEVDYAVRCLLDAKVNSSHEEGDGFKETQEYCRPASENEELSPPMRIHFKPDSKQTVSSCDSSPPPEIVDLLQISENSQSSRSEDSSPRASPEYRSRHQDDDIKPCSPGVYAMSPRMSAGESMVMVDMANRQEQVMDATNLLLRRTFPEVYLHEGLTMSGDSISKDSLVDDANPAYISKPDTPESSSLAIAPTDSTNIDLSWSEDEDEIPSESEV